MSPRLRIVLILGVVALMLLGLFAWWRSGMVRRSSWEETRPRGEAAYNQLYGLQKALQASGRSVQSRRRLQLDEHPLEPGDTVVMLQDTLGLQESDTYRLLEWVEQGGHLVVAMPQGDPALQGAGHAGVTEVLGVQGVTDGKDSALFPCMQMTAAGASKPQSVFCFSPRFRLTQGEPELGVRDPQAGWVMARIAHGEGSVDVLSSLDFLDRGELELPVSAALATQLLAPNDGKGSVHLIYEPGTPSLWLTLLRRGWMAWVPALLALAGWLWWRAQRRGPLLPAHVQARRSLVEHVRASGEHLWRHRRGDLLHQAERERFLARLRRRDPIAATQEGMTQAEIISALTGTSAAAIARALQTPAPQDAHALRERIALLVELGHRL